MPQPDFLFDEDIEQIFDMRPKLEGNLPLIFKDGSWIPFEGCLVGTEQMKPLTLKEAASITGDSSLLK